MMDPRRGETKVHGETDWPEPVIRRWPGWARVATIVVLTFLLWALIYLIL